MKSYRRSNRKGFTLVEILIVVIILGILAAIVIPQFTNASSDARQSSMTSQLQTIRSQVELYKLQHGDVFPTTDGAIDSAWDWTKLTGTSTGTNGATVGPYLQTAPINPLNNLSNVVSLATAPAVGTVEAGGYVFAQDTGKVYGVDKDSKLTAD